ncbi:hypothetical protein HD554DRAFT_1441910 [Boletus coccyginus]|nr:hypothetical protein HD554DRAFT_1441910 [Boletus coccyginus]
MICTARLTSFLALAASLPLAKAAALDVWAPQILYPKSGTQWYAGEDHHVTCNAPSSITNPNGQIYLVSGGQILFDYQLANGFDIRDGRVQVHVPNVHTGEYQVVLFGDSGDTSAGFTITGW